MNAVPPVRVLIADNHPITREGLTALLTRLGLYVVAQASDGQQAVALYRQHRPDVAVLDVRMPGMSGLDALRRIRSEFPHANVVMLSTYEEEETVYQSLQAGACSYLLKDVSPEQLCHTLIEAAQGRRCLPPHITEHLMHRMQSQSLTPRELEVLQAMAQGKSNQEIARALFISEGTVKIHVSNLLTKMEVDDRTQAVTMAIQRGLAPLDATS